MLDDLKPARRAVEALRGSAPEPEISDSTSGGFARQRSREQLMLDVCLEDGTHRAFSYAYLTGAEYIPGDRLRLAFGPERVVLEGRNLSRLYQLLIEHRVATLKQEGPMGDLVKRESDPHIDDIHFETEEER